MLIIINKINAFLKYLIKIALIKTQAKTSLRLWLAIVFNLSTEMWLAIMHNAAKCVVKKKHK